MIMSLPLRIAATVAALAFALLAAVSCQETIVGAERDFTLRGEVVAEADGTPVAGALVSLSPALDNVLTDDDGRFEFASLSTTVESYTLNVESDGFRRFVRALSTETIDDNDAVVSVLVELEPAVETQTDLTPPSDPTPVDDTTDVARDLILSWSASGGSDPDQLRFDVRFGGRDGIRTIAEGLRDTFLHVDDLGFSESYFWQVTVYEATGGERVNGPVWTFATEPEPDYAIAFALANGSAPTLFAADVDIEREDYLQILPTGQSGFRPVWSPTGTSVAYLGYDGPDLKIFVARADGSDVRALTSRPLTDVITDQYRFDWNRSGTRVVYGELNEIFSVDAVTGQSIILATVPANRKVTEVSVHPNVDRLAYRATSSDGLITDVLELELRTNRLDTIVGDTVGLVTGPVYSPSGNEVLVTIDISGQENTRRRQLDARVFEIDLVRGFRRLISVDKGSGLNDLQPTYSPSGGDIFFTRGLNTPGSVPAIFRVDRNDFDGAEQIIPEGTGPSIR